MGPAPLQKGERSLDILSDPKLLLFPKALFQGFDCIENQKQSRKNKKLPIVLYSLFLLLSFYNDRFHKLYSKKG